MEGRVAYDGIPGGATEGRGKKWWKTAIVMNGPRSPNRTDIWMDQNHGNVLPIIIVTRMNVWNKHSTAILTCPVHRVRHTCNITYARIATSRHIVRRSMVPVTGPTMSNYASTEIKVYIIWVQTFAHGSPMPSWSFGRCLYEEIAEGNLALFVHMPISWNLGHLSKLPDALNCAAGQCQISLFNLGVDQI